MAGLAQSLLQQSPSLSVYDNSAAPLEQLGMKADDYVGGTWKLPGIRD